MALLPTRHVACLGAVRRSQDASKEQGGIVRVASSRDRVLA